MMDYGEGRNNEPRTEGRDEAARQDDITLRPISSGETASSVFREQENGSRLDALVLEVPSPFVTTREALEWVKQAKALEQESYGASVSEGGSCQPSSVAYDPGKSLPCLVVLAPALAEIEDPCSRREEEKVRVNLAEEGAIVFDRGSPEVGGCQGLDDLREAMRPMLQCEEPCGRAPAGDPAMAFFQALSPAPPGSEAYGRFPTHIDPLEGASLQEAVEKAFKEFGDRDNTPWWDLDY